MSTNYSKEMFYKSRSLAGRLAASFRFINSNLMVFVKLGLYILVPLALVQSLFGFYITTITPERTMSLLSYIIFGVVLVISIVGICLYSSFVYTLIKKHSQEIYLKGFTSLKQLKEPLTKNAFKFLWLGILQFIIGFILGVIISSVAMITPYSLYATIPLFIIICLPFVYTGFIYIIEETTLIKAFIKSFKMGMKHWGATFTIFIISTIIGGLVQVIVSLPYIICLIISFFSYQSMTIGEVADLPAFYPYLMFLVTFISVVAFYLAQILTIVPMSYQYACIVTAEKERLLEEKSFAQEETNLKVTLH